MAAYRRVYDSRHLQADCQEPGSAPEPYARRSSMVYLFYNIGQAEGSINVEKSLDPFRLFKKSQCDTVL